MNYKTDSQYYFLEGKVYNGNPVFVETITIDKLFKKVKSASFITGKFLERKAPAVTFTNDINETGTTLVAYYGVQKEDIIFQLTDQSLGTLTYNTIGQFRLYKVIDIVNINVTAGTCTIIAQPIVGNIIDYIEFISKVYGKDKIVLLKRYGMSLYSEPVVNLSIYKAPLYAGTEYITDSEDVDVEIESDYVDYLITAPVTPGTPLSSDGSLPYGTLLHPTSGVSLETPEKVSIYINGALIPIDEITFIDNTTFSFNSATLYIGDKLIIIGPSL